MAICEEEIVNNNIVPKKRILSVRLAAVMMLVMMLMASLAGCGKLTSDTEDTSAEVDEKQTEEATEIMAEEDEEVSAPVAFELPDEAYGSSVLAIGDRLYLFGDMHVFVVDPSTGEQSTIVGEETKLGDQYFPSREAINLGDKLYYITRDEKDDVNLVQNKLDGTAPVVIDTYPGDTYASWNLYYTDHTIFVDGSANCYTINDNAEVTDVIPVTEHESYAGVPEGYALLDAPYSGVTLFPAMTLKHYGKLVLNDDVMDAVTRDPAKGSERLLGGYVSAVNDSKVLIYECTDAKYIYGLIDMKTGEYKFLFKNDDYKAIFDMDDSYAYGYTYGYENNEEGEYVFYRISLSNGKEEPVYMYNRENSALNYTPWGGLSPVKIGDTLITACSHDGDMFFNIIDLKSGNAISADKPYYSTGVSQVGTLVHRSEKYTNDEGIALITAESTVINIDSRYESAKVINSIINDMADSVISYCRDEYSINEVTEWYEVSSEDGFFSAYEHSLDLDKITYLKGDIINITGMGYDYMGGAHGMPWMTSLVFNLQTGKRYMLTDLVTVDEDTLKEVMVRGFERLKEENPDTPYWDEAADTVYMYADMRADNFYLTEDAIVFYFPPYELASYADGFQDISIPYEELGIDMSAN